MSTWLWQAVTSIFWLGVALAVIIAIVTTVVWAALVYPANRRRAWAAQRERLIADCDYEHAAWRRGDDAIATFGRFQP